MYNSRSYNLYLLGLARYILSTSVVGAVCCVLQLVAASVALAHLLQLQRLAAVSMPDDEVDLLGYCRVCCGGCCLRGCCCGGRRASSSWCSPSGPALEDPADPYAAAAAQREQGATMAVAAYPRSYWAGELATPRTGHGIQALTTEDSEAFH